MNYAITRTFKTVAASGPFSLSDSSAFLLCDIQERFRDIVHAMPSVIQVGKTLAGF